MKCFIAVQTGARRNYAVPSILEKAGMLDALYTDLCANAGLGAVFDKFCPPPLRHGALSRILNRRLPHNIEEKVHTFDWATLRYLARQKLAGDNLIKQRQALTAFSKEFGQEMIYKGLGQANHVFSMFGEGSDFLRFAKKKALELLLRSIYLL